VKTCTGLPRSNPGLCRKGEGNAKKIKAGLEEMDAAVIVFKERMGKMNIMD
jgi:hypothetical protein